MQSLAVFLHLPKAPNGSSAIPIATRQIGDLSLLRIEMTFFVHTAMWAIQGP